MLRLTDYNSCIKFQACILPFRSYKRETGNGRHFQDGGLKYVRFVRPSREFIGFPQGISVSNFMAVGIAIPE
jgi:hypothetical protein